MYDNAPRATSFVHGRTRTSTTSHRRRE